MPAVDNVRLLRRHDQVIDPLPGTIGIQASVGQYGTNRREDARGIQVALNAIPRALGGADESRAVDGLVGPLTIGAIKTFQSHWFPFQDGRCDPKGPTLALLNRMAGVGDAIPDAVARGLLQAAPAMIMASNLVGAKAKPKPPPLHTPDEMMKAAVLRYYVVHYHHLPLCYEWLMRGLRWLAKARRHAQRLKTLGAAGLPAADLRHEDRIAFLRVAKHFHLHEKDPDPSVAAIDRIDTVLRKSMLVVARTKLSTPILPAPPPSSKLTFVCLWKQPAHMKRVVIGYAYLGGIDNPGHSGNANEGGGPGHWASERNEQIFLPPAFDNTNPDHQRMTLVHELAHSVGPRLSSGHAVADKAYVFEHAKYKAMTRERRLQNADTYGMFVLELARGTFDAIRAVHTENDTIGIWPVMEANSVVQPEARLPQDGDPDLLRFAFPAGFPLPPAPQQPSVIVRNTAPPPRPVPAMGLSPGLLRAPPFRRL